MSYEVSDGRKSLGQFASNSGYAELVHELSRDKHLNLYPALTALLDDGYSKQLAECEDELRDVCASAPSNVADTAAALLTLIADRGYSPGFGQPLIVISDGTSAPNDVSDDVSGFVPQPALGTTLKLDRMRFVNYRPDRLEKALRNPGHMRDTLRTFASSLRSDLMTKVKALGPTPSQSSLDSAIDAMDWTPLAASLEPHLRDMAIRGGLDALESVHISDKASRRAVFDAAVSTSKRRAASIIGMRYTCGELVDDPDAEYAINRTARRELKKLAAEGKDLGSAQSFSPQRLDLTTDTETARARHEGKASGFKAAGVDLVDWILDPRYKGMEKVECPCPDLASNGPYAVDNIPDLPHPRCACTLQKHVAARKAAAPDDLAKTTRTTLTILPKGAVA